MGSKYQVLVTFSNASRGAAATWLRTVNQKKPSNYKDRSRSKRQTQAVVHDEIATPPRQTKGVMKVKADNLLAELGLHQCEPKR